MQNQATYYTKLSVKSYHPFGMAMPGRSYTSESYRFGFNGKEQDGEDWTNNAGNQLDFGARIYDSRLGRWLSVDPLMIKYPSWSSYNFVLNSPLINLDPDGQEVYTLNKNSANIVVKDLNAIYKAEYNVENAFKVETRCRTVQVKVSGTGPSLFHPFRKTEYKTVDVEEYFIVTNDANMDFNTDEYTTALYDMLNTNDFKVNFDIKTTDKNKGVGGFTHSNSYFTIESGLEDAIDGKNINLSVMDADPSFKSTPGHTTGGIFLHELLFHISPQGKIDDKRVDKKNGFTGFQLMQNKYGLRRSNSSWGAGSSSYHNAGDYNITFNKEQKQKLDEKRAKTGPKN